MNYFKTIVVSNLSKTFCIFERRPQRQVRTKPSLLYVFTQTV